MDGIYELVMGGIDGAGNYAENVFHYAIQGSSSGHLEYETAHELCSAFGTTNIPLLQPLLGTDVTINVLSARRVDGPGGPTYTIPVAADGTGGVESFTQAAAIDCAMYPGGAANKVGHMYLWGIVNTAISAGAVVGGFLSSLATLFTALLTALTVDGGSAKLSTYTKATNVATFVTAMVSRSKVSGFSKRTAPIN
jgi:hypothetical protein